jgi:hypothetical protein
MAIKTTSPIATVIPTNSAMRRIGHDSMYASPALKASDASASPANG